jgi:hypothetical protein
MDKTTIVPAPSSLAVTNAPDSLIVGTLDEHIQDLSVPSIYFGCWSTSWNESKLLISGAIALT